MNTLQRSTQIEHAGPVTLLSLLDHCHQLSDDPSIVLAWRLWRRLNSGDVSAIEESRKFLRQRVEQLERIIEMPYLSDEKLPPPVSVTTERQKIQNALRQGDRLEFVRMLEHVREEAAALDKSNPTGPTAEKIRLELLNGAPLQDAYQFLFHHCADFIASRGGF